MSLSETSSGAGGNLLHRLPRGSYTPLVTPFQEGAIDWEAFDRLVERQVDGGGTGIVVTGTSGEPSSLSAAERAELFARAVSTAAGRVIVVAAVGASDQATTLELTAAATEIGCDAAMVVAPAFVQPSQRGLVEHFVTVAGTTDLPVLLYNIPGRAAVAIEPATVIEVAKRCPNLVGVKHASADLDYVTYLTSALGEDFRLFCGLESYSYPFLAVGGAGLMNAVGNILPQALSSLCRAVESGDHTTALRLHRVLFDINKAIFFDTNPIPLKTMLAARGVCSAEVRPPLTGLDEPTHRQVMDVLAAYVGDGAGEDLVQPAGV
jgi:4-hydroxy-tetrahydrodipicolinate synthase